MRVNYHCHSRYCRHAFGEVKDYAESAVKNNLEILAFSDHAPFPHPLFRGGRYGNGMDFDELDSYLSEVKNVQCEYAEKLKIYSALEIEYLPEFDALFEFNGKTFSSYYQWLLQEKQLDFLLFGSHFYIDSKGSFQNIYTISDANQVVEYAKASKKALESGYFKIFAHPDIFAMIDFSLDKKYSDYLEKAGDIIIDSAIKNNIILELNANGMRRGLFDYGGEKRFQYPLLSFWEKVSKTELKMVVGSDCHKPDLMWDFYVEKGYELLKQLGITPVEKIF